jgi:ribulose 1,5-bisphosphate synthetase/thiazole synthase
MKNNKHKFVDVIIIGAGISGIGAACHLKKNCPKKSFLILEGKEIKLVEHGIYLSIQELDQILICILLPTNLVHGHIKIQFLMEKLF